MHLPGWRGAGNRGDKGFVGGHRYYFVLDNSFSVFTDKWVEGSVILKYDD